MKFDLEERLGKTGPETHVAGVAAVRQDARFAGVGEDEFGPPVDAAQLAGGDELAGGVAVEQPPAFVCLVFRIEMAVTGKVEDVVAVVHQLALDVGARGVVGPDETPAPINAALITPDSRL